MSHNKIEVIINATMVSGAHEAQFFEFVLDEQLQLIECGHIKSLVEGKIVPVLDFATAYHGVLFELNHVRVNPQVDNSKILAALTQELEQAGAFVNNVPSQDMLAACFKPIGELTEIVRFYPTCRKKLVFLTKSVQLKSV